LKDEILTTNPNFGQRFKFWGKNRNFAQKSNFLKDRILVNNQNCVQNKNIAENFGPKSKCSKTKINSRSGNGLYKPSRPSVLWQKKGGFQVLYPSTAQELSNKNNRIFSPRTGIDWATSTM